jgi:hypothetical protein
MMSLLTDSIDAKTILIVNVQLLEHVLVLEYICLKTKPVTNFPKDVPIIHNPDERFYVQPLEDQSVLIGGFLRESKPIFANGVPETFNYSLLPDNWDDFREASSFFLLTVPERECLPQTGY